MAISFPVPEGLLDLLRDFTVSVVKDKPYDLEKYASEYFSELALAMERVETSESVECSKTRSFLEFDESMYVGYGADRLDDDHSASQKGSQRSMAESQGSHGGSETSARSGEQPAKEKCPDDAERCWEMMMQEKSDAAPSRESLSVAVDSAIEVKERAGDEAKETEEARESAVSWNRTTEDHPERESVRAGSAVRVESTARGLSAVRESSIGAGSTSGKESIRTSDDMESVKSGQSAQSKQEAGVE